MNPSNGNRKKPHTARKTPSVTPLRPGRNGGQLRSGNPGNKGGGRPPDSWYAFLERLRKDPLVQAALERAAQDETSPGFKTAVILAKDYDPEKPAEKHELSMTPLEDILTRSHER